jgi:SAM-dependent methyltransferase
MVERDGTAVDPSNSSMAESWDGDGGAFWAANAQRFDRAMREYQEPFLLAAGIEADSRVLDFGCGCGQTTRDAARIAVRGSVTGVDLSAAMLEVAGEIAVGHGLTNVTFTRADAQVHPFPSGAFDVALSRMGCMFFGDPAAAFANVGRALRPGGRLALLVWQAFDRNPWMQEIVTALAAGRDLPAPPPDAPGPFALSDPERVRGILRTAGFTEPTFTAVREPMFFGTNVEDAYELVIGLAGWILDGLDDAGRARGLAALRASLAAHADKVGVAYPSAAWLVTATRNP